MNRLRVAYGRDTTLLTVRLLIGVVMFAHGYQKLVIKGIGQTTDGFESMSIPVAIVSASFVTVVEFVGGLLLLVGLMCTTVAALEGFIMAGAAFFVHGRHGIFVADGGWELVGCLGAALAALAAAGPGRFSLAHLLQRHRDRTSAPALRTVGPIPAPEPGSDVFGPLPGSDHPLADPVPAAGLPYVPVVRFAPAPSRSFPTYAPVPNRDRRTAPQE